MHYEYCSILPSNKLHLRPSQRDNSRAYTNFSALKHVKTSPFAANSTPAKHEMFAVKGGSDGGVFHWLVERKQTRTLPTIMQESSDSAPCCSRTNKRTPLDRLYNSVILPSLTYGCESWTCTDGDWRLLQVAPRRMERRLVGTSLLHRRSNQWLRSRSGIRDVREEAEKRKLEWAKKLAKMEQERWPRRIVEWTPREFVRRSGGQKPRWRDSIVARHGRNWLRALRD